MAIEQIKRMIETEAGFNYLINDSKIFNLLISSLFEEDEVMASELVSSTIIKLCETWGQRTAIFLWPPKKESIFTTYVSESKGIILIRLLNLFSSISTLSFDWFNIMDQQGYFKIVVDQLYNEDILMRMNVLQIIGIIYQTDEAVSSMKKYTLTNKLLDLIKENDSGLNQMLQSQIITLFGQIAGRNSFSFKTILLDHIEFFQILHKFLSHNDDEMVQSTIFCISKLFCNRQGLEYLLMENYSNLIADFLDYINSSNAEMRASVFNALSLIMGNDWTKEIEPMDDILHLIFKKIGPSPIQIIFKNLKQPVVELKYSVLNFLKSISKYSWGLLEIVMLPELLNWILDRSKETSKKGLELKYQVINSLLIHPQSKEILGVTNYYNLNEYKKLGIFFTKAQNTTLVKEK